jgi:hypothetical protein
MSLWIALALIALVVPLWVGLARINELFVLRARKGRLTLVRGKIPPRLLGDLRDVMEKAPDAEAELRAVVEDGRAVIHARPPLPAPLQQRLRNTISLWPLAKIRQSSRR